MTPALRSAARDAEDAGDFKAILCWDQDRFGRFDSIEAGEWILPLRRARLKELESRLADLDRQIARGKENVLLVGAADLPDLKRILDGWR